MAFCKTVDRLYTLLPLRPVRDLLIRIHMDGCPRCQARLLSRTEARRLLVAPDDVGDLDGLWARIASRADKGAGAAETSLAPVRPLARWAAAAATALAVAVTGFWLLHEIQRRGFDSASVPPADRFQIDYIQVGGAPAQAFVFQPQGSDTIFVWAQRIP